MAKILVTILSLFSLTGFIQAATFIPLSMEKQLERSSSVIQGIYRNSSFKRLPNGDVVTLASFEIEKISGLTSSQILNHRDYKVMLPGGEWDGLTYFVTGVPSFKPGERVVLLLLDTPYGPIINNLALGKYHIVQREEGSVLVSDVFPQHPSLGNIALESFENMLITRFGSGLAEHSLKNQINRKVSSDTTDKSLDAGEERTPASIAEEKASSFSPLLLVIILALLGAYGAYLVRER